LSSNKFATLFALALALTLAPMANAGLIDLTQSGNTVSGTGDNGTGFIVQQDGGIKPTGTGFIDSFVRIQQTGNEQGFNSSLSTPLDTKAGNFTHAIQLADVGTVTIAGKDYLTFALDINQNSNNLLSLNQIQLFASSGDLGNTATSGQYVSGNNAPVLSFGANAVELFRLNGTTTVGTGNPGTEILMDYTLGNGSGSGDMRLFIEVTPLIAALPSTTYLTLYSQFGTGPGTQASNDGFEEWWTISSSPGPNAAVPEPASVAMALTGIFGFGLAGLRRYRRKVA
jgi:hypothetical protein